MKKLILFLFILFFSLPLFADFVEKRFDEEQISIEESVSHFNEWFGTGDSEFRLFFDETDELGMRDQDYQQYINGVKIENCALYVHSKNGFVTLINGDIMPQNKTPKLSSNISPRKAIKIATGQDTTLVSPQKTIIHKLNKENGFDYYMVYEVITEYEVIYVECSTGEIVHSLPLFSNSKVCSVETRYNGSQTINCETNSDSKYILRNDAKNLRTLFACLDATTDLPANRYNFTNSSSNWSGNYLTTVVITAVHNSGWWNPYVGDASPDLYIRITDANGNLLYVSDYKEDCGDDTQFPVTFRISEMVKIPANSGYKIEIWDEDLGEDSKGSTITLTSNNEGSYTWGSSSSNTEGNFYVTQWHPALDVQWGLEKTWDFYNSEFNHQGFDGNNALTRAILHSPVSVNNIAAEKSYSIYNTAARNPNNAVAYYPKDGSDVSKTYIYFGIGNEKGESHVDLNCVSHEFTHLVTAFRPKGVLVYSGESGAINEGYSDAMAVAVEAKLKGSINWLFGHGVQQVGMYDNNIYDYCRNIANPKAGGPEGPKPDTYGKGPWVDPTNTSKENDDGGVHMNNSIFTHWFYILCEGKTGVNDNQQSYSVSPIGLDKALKIIWRMHRTYLPQQATFAQARKWAIQSAQELYPNEKDVVKTVTNAWYAVGVGEKYTDEASTDNYVVLAQRNASSDWFYMTSDLGTASNKRYQAVDAGTNVLENVNTSNLDSKYYWQIEENKLHTAAGYSAWTSGNTAILNSTGKELTIQRNNDGTYTFSFLDGEDTRRLALNATAGNDYFAYYKGANHTYKLTLIKEGEHSVPTMDIEELFNSSDKPTKLLRNGQVLILLGNKTYTLTGAEVK